MASQNIRLLWFRFGLTCYAMAYALALPMAFGIQGSYSSYHAVAPIIFPLATTIISLGLWLHRSKEWEIPAIALVVVSLFNMFEWPMIHNTAAMAFFMSATAIMIRDKRYGLYGIKSLLFYPLLMIIEDGGLFWFEAIQIVLVAAYHMRRVLHLIELNKRKQK